MRFAITIEPQQGYTYADIRDTARRAESAGFEAFFRSDHYSSMGTGPELSTSDAWTTLAALALDTTTIRLGTLVSPVTFRHPGQLAKVVATVDEISAGRVEVGLGVGWFEIEHRRYGFQMPPLPTRFDMLEDALAILQTLWGPDGGSYRGRVWSVIDAASQPKTVQRPHPPIILGGHAGPRGALLAARYAAEYNVFDVTPSEAGERFGRVRDACLAIGRDPETLTRSMMISTIVGRDSDELDRRIEEALAETRSGIGRVGIQQHRGRKWLVGTIDEVADRIGDYEAAGVQRIVFQLLVGRDLDHVDLLAEISQHVALVG